MIWDFTSTDCVYAAGTATVLHMQLHLLGHTCQLLAEMQRQRVDNYEGWDTLVSEPPSPCSL